MKKFLFLIIAFLMFFISAKTFAAQGYMPKYINPATHFGIGALRVSNNVIIYENPDINSKTVFKIYWNNTGAFLTSDENFKTPSEIFLAFEPEENAAFLSAEDEEGVWVKVCYNQKNHTFGWVKTDEINPSKFYTYPDLINKFGKVHGLYLFNNLPDSLKSLKSAPNDEAKTVDTFNIPKYISPWLVQGNWVLVKITMWDNKTTTGWLRWRGESGRLFAFVNFK